MSSVEPLVPWEADATTEIPGEVVWWSRLDGHYMVEVRQLADRKGRLLMFDINDENKVVHDEEVGLSYGAVFGPDVADVAAWQDICAGVADSL